MAIDLLDAAWNDDIIDDVQPGNYENVIVYSRDWTVETIYNQITQNNIDLNPRFQRRNAWNDQKRSRLIESLVIGIPIPEIVLAEDQGRKKSFLVIDGKQRLLTIAGYIDPSILYWTRPDLAELDVCTRLNRVTYEELASRTEFAIDHRAFLNADIRCTVISNYDSDDILYDIFYRMNTGSVPLSTQELRQVLIRGPFANRLIEITKEPLPIHQVLGLDEPDPRLRDVEIILRSLAFESFSAQYQGNLKRFLDDSMRRFSLQWEEDKTQIENMFDVFNQATRRVISVFGEDKKVGRKFSGGKWEGRFNKSIFEAELYYFARIPDSAINDTANNRFVKGFESICENDPKFKSSIETTTKTNENYVIRFNAIRSLINQVYKLNITEIPVSTISR